LTAPAAKFVRVSHSANTPRTGDNSNSPIARKFAGAGERDGKVLDGRSEIARQADASPVEAKAVDLHSRGACCEVVAGFVDDRRGRRRRPAGRRSSGHLAGNLPTQW